MVKCNLMVMSTALLLTTSFTHASDGWYATYEEAKNTADSKGLPLLIHFHAAWCGPCRQMASQVLSQPDVQRELRNGLVAVEVDVSQHPEIARQYGASTVPRDVVVTPGKAPRTLNVGFKSTSAYLAMIHSVSRPADTSPNTPADKTMKLIGLEGFCPVKLLGSREWVTGKKDIVESYRGVTYHLSSEEARQAFLKNPRKYSPQNLGCDPVVLYKNQQAVTGKIKYGAFFDSQLYLFNSDNNRKSFKENPLKYARIRHAIRINELAGQRFN